MRQNNKMGEFRWIKISLFLILVLHFRAITGQDSYSTVRDGDEVTLSCENVINDQDKCDGTTWLFVGSGSTYAVALIELGQIDENAKAKSDRLSVTADCSLVIKKVTVEDVGDYTCRQFKSGRQQGQDSRVFLSVVTMTEHRDTSRISLYCSLLTYGECRHTVKWLYDGQDVDKQYVRTSQSHCFAAVTLKMLHHKSNYYELFKCKVTDKSRGEVQQFTYSPPSSVRTDFSALSYATLVMHVAELLLIIIVITILLFRARGNQRPPDDNTVLNSGRSRTVKRSGPAASQVHYDEDEDVKYENF